MESARKSWHTDWSKCCLCQKDKSEDLKSPQANPAKNGDDGYKSLARNIPMFYSINAMPIKLFPGRLDIGDGIEETMRKHNAQYHETCRLLFNSTKLQRAQKRSTSAATADESSSSKIPRKVGNSSTATECFLCEKEVFGDDIRHAMTMKLNNRLNDCAKTLGDGKLLARLSAGDAVAQDLIYHPKCLANLYNRERAHQNIQEQEKVQAHNQKFKDAYPIAFAELITYITELKAVPYNSDPKIFKLADLATLYRQRLEQLGVQKPEVHATRLKDQLLFHIPELQAHRKGRDVFIAFEKDIGIILQQATEYSEAIHLGKAAAIIRRDMLKHKSSFCSTFQVEYKKEAVPSSLLQFVCMIEHGADIKSQIVHGASKSDLAMSQLLQYNCFAKSKEGTKVHRHCKDRETPFAVYLALSVYGKTRKRHLIDMLHENGLSISYDRVLEITAKLGEAVVAQYVEDGVVCPPALRKQLFTTSAVDNIDHNPTATTAKTSFHGTSVSIFQHPSLDHAGEVREPLILNPDIRVKKVSELPEAFTSVRPAYI